MDYRKNVNTPRDMIDDETLLRLMRESEPVAATFGGTSCKRRSADGRRNCAGERRDESRSYTERCGCGTVRREERNENSDRERNTENNDERRRTTCENCVNDERMRGFPLAMAYVPWQEWEELYDEDTALTAGTLFRALDLPWYQTACGKGNDACKR